MRLRSSESCSQRAGSGRSIWFPLLAVWVATACGGDIEAGFRSADELTYREQYVEAARLYTKLIARLDALDEPASHHLQLRLKGLRRLVDIHAMHLRNYEETLELGRRLVREYPKSQEAFATHIIVADILRHRLGRVEAAIAEYQRAVNEFPDRPESPRVQHQVVSAYFQLKDYEQAQTEAEVLTRRWPNSAEALQARFDIGNALYLQAQFDAAAAVYRQILESRPSVETAALALFELGNCYFELRNQDEALAHYFASLSQHPNPAIVRAKIHRIQERSALGTPSADIQVSPETQTQLARRGLNVRTRELPGPPPAAPGPGPSLPKVVDADPSERNSATGAEPSPVVRLDQDETGDIQEAVSDSKDVLQESVDPSLDRGSGESGPPEGPGADEPSGDGPN